MRFGSYRNKEVDFTAIMGTEVEYYQVAMTVLTDETRKREFSSLELIKDNFPKTVLTMDRFNLGTFGGIRAVNVINWMLGADVRYPYSCAHPATAEDIPAVNGFLRL